MCLKLNKHYKFSFIMCSMYIRTWTRGYLMKLYCPSILQGLKNLPHSVSTDPPASQWQLMTFLLTPEGERILTDLKSSQPSCLSFPSSPNSTNPKLSELIHSAQQKKGSRHYGQRKQLSGCLWHFLCNKFNGRKSASPK